MSDDAKAENKPETAPANTDAVPADPTPKVDEPPIKLTKTLGEGAKNGSKAQPKTDPGTRCAPPPFIKIQPDLRGQFDALAISVKFIRGRLNRKDQNDWAEVEETMSRCFCRELVFRTEQWASAFMRITSRANDLSLGLTQDLIANVHALSPLKRQGHPTVIADPDYVKKICDAYLKSKGYGDIQGDGLVLSVATTKTILDKAMHRDVWTETPPTRAESLLMHGIVEGAANPQVTGPTMLPTIEEVRAAKLNHSPYKASRFGYFTVYTMRIRNPMDRVLSVTSAQYTATQPIPSEDYISRCLVPAYRK